MGIKGHVFMINGLMIANVLFVNVLEGYLSFAIRWQYGVCTSVSRLLGSNSFIIVF